MESQKVDSTTPAVTGGGSCLGVSIIRKGMQGPVSFVPIGLAPQKVLDVVGSDPTRDTYQRKVFFDGTNFFLAYWDATNKQVLYTASADGITWTAATVLWTFSVAPYFGGNVDICYPNQGTLDADGDPSDLEMHFTGSNGATSNWYPFTISGQTLTEGAAAAVAGQSKAQGGSVVCNLNGTNDYMIFHRNTTTNLVRTHRSPADVDASDATLSHGQTTTGGCQLLPYKTSSPYIMFALAKDASDVLYYNTVNEPTATFAGTWTTIATLTTGFSDFCACSEAQDAGDPEKVHMVYIKSSGELTYRLFEDDVLGSEVTLESSGATYPVIATDSNGKLYVFYVKSGKIWVKHNNGDGWLAAVGLFDIDHTYSSPTYLSTNQYMQSGRICLVWTEGTGPSYEVWFCYLQ